MMHIHYLLVMYLIYLVEFDRSGATQNGSSHITALMFMAEEIDEIGLVLEDDKVLPSHKFG
jgi:hypothetical protein